MFSASQTGISRVALAQAVLAPVVALLYGAVAGFEAGLAALYGSLTALAVSAVLLGRERQAMRHPEWDQHRLMKLFIRTGIERLIVLLVLLVVGLGVLKLLPLPLLLGLVFAQLGWLAAASGSRRQ
ncbi:MAG: ATP synthase subunit I [Gammaproteobacteria bacterium]